MKIRALAAALALVAFSAPAFAGHCPSDMAKIDAALAGNPGLGADQLVPLAFGAMREYKGIPELITAFAEIAPEHPDSRLLIVGKPIRVDVGEYREQLREAGLGDRVTLRPEYVPLGDIGDYFAACDVAVYPYRHINQSGALQLAYGAGRPVVASVESPVMWMSAWTVDS